MKAVKFFISFIFVFITGIQIAKSFQVSNSMPPVDLFVDRDQYIIKIKEQIHKRGYVFISGEGGIGKTQIVRKYLSNLKDQYQIIWWFNNPDNYLLDFKELLSQSRIKVSINTENVFKKYLEQANSKKINTVFIFDNIVDRDSILKIVNQFQNNKYVKVIFISRENFNLNAQVIIKPFNTEQSIHYLSDVLSGDKIEDIRKLADILKGHPLLLEQASSFILSDKYGDISNYLKILKNESIDLSKNRWEHHDIKNDYNQSVYNVINLSILAVKEKDMKAYNLMKALSFLSDEFGDNLLRQLFSIRAEKFYMLEYTKAINTLLRYNMLEIKKSNGEGATYQIHQLKKDIINEITSIEDLDLVIKSLLDLIPKKLGFIDAFAEKNKLLIKNIATVLNYARKRGVITENILS